MCPSDNDTNSSSAPTSSNPEREAGRTPNEAAKDEQIVNVALLLYVNALVMTCESEVAKGIWTPHRKSFHVKARGQGVRCSNGRLFSIEREHLQDECGVEGSQAEIQTSEGPDGRNRGDGYMDS
jgi:hypothetical protein